MRDQASQSKASQKAQDSRPAAGSGGSAIAPPGYGIDFLDQPEPNRTGLPDRLKSGVESLSGYSMEDVRVHYDSEKPAQLQAFAYAQGNEIHLGPGQEKHLPHEAWHVVQQKQGRVQANIQAKGRRVNDDPALEREADAMGAKAASAAPKGRPFLLAKTPLPTLAPVQLARKNRDEMAALTVEAFDRHRKAEQMDWANAAFTDQERTMVWDILDWGVSGLAAIKLDDIFKDTAADAKNFSYMKNYCQALTGELAGQPTVQLERLNDKTAIEKQGKWVDKLNATIGGPRVRATIPKYAFEFLIKDQKVAEAFLDYYKTCNPILQTPTGREVTAFVELVGDEKAKIGDYKPFLPDIRNYHKFEKASLDKLKTDKGQKDKPLTLVLQSLYDHNGAFIRHAHVNKVIQNANIRVYVLEGLNVEKLKSLKKDGLDTLAKDHGMGGKITQVMFAGHGASNLMEMAGEGTDVVKDADTGEYKVKEKSPTYLYFGSAGYDAFWSEFFEAVFKNMALQGGLQPKVLLRACLTASNELNVQKLKKTLKDSNTVDVDDPKVDPTSDENQAKIRKAIKDQFTTSGSLVSVLTGKAKGKAQILGAQASISAATTGSVKPTGELDVVALTDPKVAAPKIEYAREGKEPTGALKAVIESWADDRDKCFKAMDDRLKDPVATDDEFIIHLLYSTILAGYKKDIIAANGFVASAGVLSHTAPGGDECRPAPLHADPMIQKHQAAFYPALLGRFANDYAKLAIHEDLIGHDNSKRKDFADLLGSATFKLNKVKKYLDFGLLDSHVDAILKLATASLRGRILLALAGFNEKKRVDCKAFLLAQVHGDQILNKEVKDEVEDEHKLRKDLGLPVEAAPPPPAIGGAAPAPKKQKNVDVKGDYYVAPLRAEVKKMTKSTLSDWAKLRTEPRDNATKIESFFWNRNFTLVGEVKKIADDSDLGWYMLRQNNGRVAYMRKKYF